MNILRFINRSISLVVILGLVAIDVAAMQPHKRRRLARPEVGIQQLPDELIHEILGFLENKDFINIMCCCRKLCFIIHENLNLARVAPIILRFRSKPEISEGEQQKLERTITERLDSFLKATGSQRPVGVDLYDLPYRTNLPFDLLRKFLDNRKVVCLRLTHMPRDVEEEKAFMKALVIHDLEEFALKGEEEESIWQTIFEEAPVCPRLKKLIIPDTFSHCDQWLSGRRFPNLCVLSINHRVPVDVLANLQTPSLRALILRPDEEYSEEEKALGLITANVLRPTLKHLNLEGVLVEDRFLQALPSQVAENLVSLYLTLANISGYEPLTAHTWSKLTILMLDLSLSYCSLLPINLPAHFEEENFPKLRELTLIPAGGYLEEDAHIQIRISERLKSKLPNIVKIILVDIFNIQGTNHFEDM